MTSDPQDRPRPLREVLADVHRLGGAKGLAMVFVASGIGLTLAIVDHFRPGLADRAMEALERRYPRTRKSRGTSGR